MAFGLFVLAYPAAAQNADDYRGGWRTDSGEAHTYEFSIRGTTVGACTAPTAPMRRRSRSSTGRFSRTGSRSRSRM